MYIVIFHPVELHLSRHIGIHSFISAGGGGAKNIREYASPNIFMHKKLIQNQNIHYPMNIN